MEDRLKTEQEMVRYLLGELSTQDRMELEMEYFNDPETFDLLQAVEHDLIEGYVNGKLSPSGRVRFERNYLTTKGRQDQVNFFRTLSEILPLEPKKQLKFKAPLAAVGSESIDPGEKRSLWDIFIGPFRGPRWALGVSMAAALLILAVVGALRIFEYTTGDDRVLVKISQPPDSSSGIQRKAEESNAKVQATPGFKIIEEPPVSPAAPKVPAMVSFSWTVPGLRVLGTNTPRIIRIPPGYEMVQIALNFPDLSPDRFSRFGITLQNSAGSEVWKRTEIRANRRGTGSSIVLNIPARHLRNGSYSLMLSGLNKQEWVDIREFYLKVER